MVKVIISAFLLVGVVGCSSWAPTTVVEKAVPILVCPPPSIAERPVLHIESITETTSDGEVVKLYRATIKQLQSYSEDLLQNLLQYKSTSEEYERLRQRVNQLVPPEPIQPNDK
jgi:hypothetical protein